MIFCTLFNWAYMPQGIALYRSLERVCKGDFVLHVLCIDDFTEKVLLELKFPRLKTINLRLIDNGQLEPLRKTRTIAEFCWTCTTPLLRHLQETYRPGSVVTYLDADLSFFSDPAVVLEELGSGSVLIHEHDFAPEFSHLKRSSGRFNVGLLAVRNDEQGRACVEKWCEQCLHECVFDPEAGKCGDQTYLDDWPRLYPNLVISSNPGVGLAPWNITKHRLGSNGRTLTVDGSPAVFYHFHSLRLLRPRLGFKPVVMASGAYLVSDSATALFYKPYARDLWCAVARIDSTSKTTGLTHPFVMEFPTLPHEYSKLLNGQLYLSLFGLPVPSKHKIRLMSWLYGIDAQNSSL
jgi:Nucleotide-diphospho-sugar transferase